ncbi:hypothetical protein D3C81_2163360 [compost metagenome]
MFIKPHIAFTAAVWPLALVVLPPLMYCWPSPQVLLVLLYTLPEVVPWLAFVMAMPPKLPPVPRLGSFMV